MKKQLLLIAATFVLLSAFAQKTDRKLLTGNWNFRSFSAPGGYNVDADNVKQTAAQRVKEAIAKAPDHVLSEKDSVALVEKTYKESAQLAASSISFKADGTVEIVLLLPIDGESNEKGEAQKGTYKWNGDKQLDVTLGEDLKIFTIRQFTANSLEVLVTQVGDSEGMTAKLVKK